MTKQVELRYINIMNTLLSTQKGYIGLTVVAFMLVLSMIIYPWMHQDVPQEMVPDGETATPEEGCTVGEAPTSEEIIKNIPAIKDVFMPAEADFSGGEPIYGGPDPVEKTDYVLVRKNVRTLQKSIDGADFLAVEGSTGWPHTVNAGELPEKPGYTAYYPSRWGELDHPELGRKYVRNLGLVIFANNNPATISKYGDGDVYLTDVYQDKRIYDAEKSYTFEQIFLCNVGEATSGMQVIIPEQAVSPDKHQLQLEWFLLQGSTWGVHCKPAVYLYPERKQLVNVKVYPKGELGYTDPLYDKAKGWTVWAQPNGSLNQELGIKNQGRTYDYLYYESKIYDEYIEKPKTGWVVSGESGEMGELFNDILPKLGLNTKEEKDFEEYWLKTLPESPYYFVGLIDKNQRDYLEKLDVTPSPDTSIRFSLYFETLDQFKMVQEPRIITPIRKGFTLVDWGGMIKLHKGTPFTCSQ